MRGLRFSGLLLLLFLSACGVAVPASNGPVATVVEEESTAPAATDAPTATASAVFTSALQATPTTARLIVTATAQPAMPTPTEAPAGAAGVAPTATALPAAGSNGHCGQALVVEVAALSLRAKPDLQAERLAAVPRGAVVDLRCLAPVDADGRRWLAVQYVGIEGWMSDRYLATTAAVPTATGAAVPGLPYVFPLRAARYEYGAYHHDYPATDIFCPIGSDYLAPTNGVVDFVNREDLWDPVTDDPALRGGIMIAIIGDDGVRYYASHLSAIAAGIAVGERVVAGQLLGLSGASGNARSTPPHIHFGISRPTTPDDWRTRRGELSPYPYLRAWEQGEQVTPDLSQIGR